MSSSLCLQLWKPLGILLRRGWCCFKYHRAAQQLVSVPLSFLKHGHLLSEGQLDEQFTLQELNWWSSVQEWGQTLRNRSSQSTDHLWPSFLCKIYPGKLLQRTETRGLCLLGRGQVCRSSVCVCTHMRACTHTTCRAKRAYWKWKNIQKGRGRG